MHLYTSPLAALKNRQQRKKTPYSITHWMRRVLLGFCLLASPHAHSNTDSTATKPTLRIAIAEMLQEPLQGEVKILRQAFDIAGYQLELVPLPAQRGLRNAAAGELDGEFLRRRIDITDFTTLAAIDEPLRHVELWVWMKAERECPHSLQALPELTMASVLSYGFTKRLAVSSGSKKIQTNSVVSSLRVLQAGRVDYVLFDKQGISHYQQQLNLNVKTCFTQPLSSTDYFTFLHSKHRDKLPALTAALRHVKNEQRIP